MNLKDRLISMDKKLVDMQYIDDTYIDDINNLFLVIETENINYSPCCYLDEDNDWVNVLVLSSENVSQCVSIRKDSIVTFGFINTGSESVTIDKKEIESYYQ